LQLNFYPLRLRHQRSANKISPTEIRHYKQPKKMVSETGPGLDR